MIKWRFLNGWPRDNKSKSGIPSRSCCFFPTDVKEATIYCDSHDQMNNYYVPLLRVENVSFSSFFHFVRCSSRVSLTARFDFFRPVFLFFESREERPPKRRRRHGYFHKTIPLQYVSFLRLCLPNKGKIKKEAEEEEVEEKKV